MDVCKKRNQTVVNKSKCNNRCCFGLEGRSCSLYDLSWRNYHGLRCMCLSGLHHLCSRQAETAAIWFVGIFGTQPARSSLMCCLSEEALMAKLLNCYQIPDNKLTVTLWRWAQLCTNQHMWTFRIKSSEHLERPCREAVFWELVIIYEETRHFSISNVTIRLFCSLYVLSHTCRFRSASPPTLVQCHCGFWAADYDVGSLHHSLEN